MNHNSPQPSVDRTGARPVLIILCCYSVLLSLEYFFSISSVLLEPTFLYGFGILILQIAIITMLAGGVGLVAGELLFRYEPCRQSMIRFLRLGRWLPFFVVWAAPIWWIRWSTPLKMPLWSEPILQLVIALIPTVIFTTCYFYLSTLDTLQLNLRTPAFTIISPVVSDTLLLSFLLQVTLFANGWQWYAPTGNQPMTRPLATILLLGGLSYLLHLISRSNFAEAADLTDVRIVRQLRETNWISFLGSGILWFLCFALWDRLFVAVRDIFTIAPLRQVNSAAYRLLTTGSMIANMEEPLWFHMRVACQEIAEGLILTVLLAIIAGKIVQAAADSTIHSSLFCALTHTVPIVLAISFIPWIGINHWFRAAIVAAISFFPFVESLWGLRDQTLPSRVLLALDNALPYAFIGMLFGQSYASTGGLGFFVVVSRAQGNRTEALATSLITFGLMVALSFTLRLSVKKLSTLRPLTI